MIKREDITSRLTVDRETNRTNLVTSLSIGSTIAFEGTTVTEEMVAGDAEDERRRIMRHIYGDVVNQLSELRGEITAMSSANFDGWRLINMIDLMRRKLQ
jgi:hypothetical protein